MGAAEAGDGDCVQGREQDVGAVEGDDDRDGGRECMVTYCRQLQAVRVHGHLLMSRIRDTRAREQLAECRWCTGGSGWLLVGVGSKE